MCNEHMTDEELIDLYYEPDAGGTSHLETCESCRERFELLVSVLERSKNVSVPNLSPSECVTLFERAWSQSRFKTGAWGWSFRLNGFIRRPALGFITGFLCGVFLTGVLLSGGPDLALKAQAEPILQWDSAGGTQTVRGQMLKACYPEIENPMIVVEPSETYEKESKRVLYGTIKNGTVQIVWNL